MNTVKVTGKRTRTSEWEKWREKIKTADRNDDGFPLDDPFVM